MRLECGAGVSRAVLRSGMDDDPPSRANLSDAGLQPSSFLGVPNGFQFR
jgi:hypothetical protein